MKTFERYCEINSKNAAVSCTDAGVSGLVRAKPISSDFHESQGGTLPLQSRRTKQDSPAPPSPLAPAPPPGVASSRVDSALASALAPSLLLCFENRSRESTLTSEDTTGPWHLYCIERTVLSQQVPTELLAIFDAVPCAVVRTGVCITPRNRPERAD